MRIARQAARASLTDIDTIVGRLKQSELYRGSSTIMVIWMQRA
jgi:hypothetical protein